MYIFIIENFDKLRPAKTILTFFIFEKLRLDFTQIVTQIMLYIFDYLEF